jgi:glycosyltransferase involved in cell wall biosynthesis
MKIAGIHVEKGAVGWHRVWCWTEAMRRMGHEVIDRPHQDPQFEVGEWDEVLAGADVVIAGRMHNAQTFAALMAGRHLYKYKLIVDTDDDQDCVPLYNQSFQNYHGAAGTPRIVRAQYREADLTTCSTTHLESQVQKYSKRSAVVPNVIDPRMYEVVRGRQKEHRHRGDLRIYWGGGGGHYDDLLMVKDVLLRIFRERPNVKLVFSNFIPDWAIDLPPFRVFMIPFTHFGAYHKILKWLCADVAIAPLVDNLFNRSKSHVKYLNYAMAGIPGVYSALLPYDSVEHGLTGLKAANSDEWYEAINTLLDNPSQRKSMAACAVDDVMENWTVDRWAPRYETMLQELVSAKKAPDLSIVTEGVPVEAPCLMSHP